MNLPNRKYLFCSPQCNKNDLELKWETFLQMYSTHVHPYLSFLMDGCCSYLCFTQLPNFIGFGVLCQKDALHCCSRCQLPLHCTSDWLLHMLSPHYPVMLLRDCMSKISTWAQSIYTVTVLCSSAISVRQEVKCQNIPVPSWNRSTTPTVKALFTLLCCT